MNCIIPGANMKIMGKALQSLSKIGDELYIEAHEDKLMLLALNMTKTAYATFEFHDTFFSSYVAKPMEASSETQTTIVKCKIHIKAVLSVFKSPTMKEKKVDICKIKFEADSDNVIFMLRYKNDIVTEYKLHLIDMEYLTLPTQNKAEMNEIAAQANFYTQMLSNFQLSDDYLTLEVTEGKTIMRNYDPNDNNVLRHIRSQIALNCTEFSIYRIKESTNITFSYKPFRAALQFAEFFNLPVTMHFGAAGKPSVITIQNVTFEVNFVIATVRPDGSTQSTTVRTISTPGNRANQSQKSSAIINTSGTNNNCSVGANITVQDQQVLESVDWDDDLAIDNLETESESRQVPRPADRGAPVASQGENPAPDFDGDETFVPDSPESPRAKKMKLIFQRCFEPTFHASRMDMGRILAENSDPECELSDTEDTMLL